MSSVRAVRNCDPPEHAGRIGAAHCGGSWLHRLDLWPEPGAARRPVRAPVNQQTRRVRSRTVTGQKVMKAPPLAPTALREKGIVPVDPKAQRELMRSSYAKTLMKMPVKKLLGPHVISVRQRMFVTALLAGPVGVRGIAKRAAEAAGYSLRDPGVGDGLVKKPHVRAAIDAHLGRAELKAQDVIDELKRIAFADLRDVAEWDGTFASPLPSDEITDDAAASVAEVSMMSTPNGPVAKIKQHDKGAALGLFAKFFGIVGADGSGSVTVNVTIEDRLREMTEDERRRAIDRYVQLTVTPPSEIAVPWRPALTSRSNGHEESPDT